MLMHHKVLVRLFLPRKGTRKVVAERINDLINKLVDLRQIGRGGLRINQFDWTHTIMCATKEKGHISFLLQVSCVISEDAFD